MHIMKNSLATTPGSREWFTGAIYVDAVAAPSLGYLRTLNALRAIDEVTGS